MPEVEFVKIQGLESACKGKTRVDNIYIWYIYGQVIILIVYSMTVFKH